MKRRGNAMADNTNGRVLIVDDNPAIHEDFQKILQADGHKPAIAEASEALFGRPASSLAAHSGFTVDSAYQGRDALEMVRQAADDLRPYTMAFVDVRMPPGWDGVETISRIWREFPDLLVIICTAYSDYSWEEIIGRLGASDRLFILKKPFDVIEVRQLAMAIAQRGRIEGELAEHREHLEELVQERTAELARANEEFETTNELLEQEIAERWRAEKELAGSKDAAEAANRAKSAFLANMSHEIRTPMTAILGFADVLLGNPNREEAGHAAETIKRNGVHLLDILDDILDLSKIEAGKMQVERVSCSPCQVVADVASLMRVRAGAKGLSLRVEYSGPIPQRIVTDPTRLRQILNNVVGNATKFTEVGGVRIVTSLIETDDAEPALRFDVIDTGIGMTAQQIDKLFTPFTQADNSVSRKFGGSGLGLTISKRLTAILGGDVTLVSTPGKGSTFSVTIAAGPLDGVPMLQRPTEVIAGGAEPERSAAAPRPRLDCRILLAEDGPDNQRLISFLLKKAGANVTLADNGQIAVDEVAAAEDPFDLILMDMQMPVLDGYGATRELRSRGYTVAIVALTAHAMKGDRQGCLDAGCNDYMTKPIDHVKLLDMVSQYAEKPRRAVGSPDPDA